MNVQLPLHNHRARPDNAILPLIDDHHAVVPLLPVRLHPVVPLQELLLRDVPRRRQRLQTLEEPAVVVVPRERADRVPGRKGGCDGGGDEGGGEEEVGFCCHGELVDSVLNGTGSLKLC